MLSPENSLRNDDNFGFHDKVFQNEMNKLMKATDENYNKMLFKETLKTGFFEMQTARDKYRELTINEEGMHKKLVHQFIEWQALALAPICPHVSEFLWMEILGNVDQVVIKSSAYLMKAAGEFRSKFKVAC